MRFAAITTVIVHIISCIWFFTAKLDGFAPDTWVSRLGMVDADNSALYLAAVYWAFSTLTTVGYGDISAYTGAERIVAIIWMCFGVAFYSFTIGNLTSLVSQIDTREKALVHKLYYIDSFAAEAQLPREMRQRLRKVLEYNNSQISFKTVECQREIFDELPLKLRCEVALEMHHGALRTITFFQDKDPTFIVAIVPLLKPFQARNTETLFEEGDPPSEAYFIIKG